MFDVVQVAWLALHVHVPDAAPDVEPATQAEQAEVVAPPASE